MRFALLIVLALFSSAAFASLADSVPSVIRNPLAMTISSVLVQPSEVKVTNGELVLYPERAQTPLLERAGKIRYAYRFQKTKTAPMVFIIPGMGGDYRAANALFLAEKFYKLGYSTVTVDSAFSWFFTVGGSHQGLPGYNPRDAQDLYKALSKIRNKLAARNGLSPQSYSLAGYSLGALHSLFLKKIDKQEGQFHFDKVLMVNPPLDMLHAITELDTMYVRGEKLSEHRKAFIFSRLLDVGGDYLTAKKPFGGVNELQSIFDTLKFTNNDMSYVISWTFRGSLKDVIFASQQVNDLGLLKNRATEYRRNARYEESGRIFFTDYLQQFVFPQLQISKGTTYTIEDLNAESSMYQFEDMLREDNGIFFVHSQDDFLLKNGDVAWAKDVFGHRAMIFPYGGHCGALGFPQFATFLNTVFKN